MVIKLSKDKNLYLFHSVSKLDLSLAMKHLSVMLKSGLGIENAIEVLSEQTPNVKLKEVFRNISKDIESGKTIAQSMRQYKKIFPEIVISVIEVGEEGASLEDNLEFLARYLKESHELQRKIKGAMLYPMVIIGITVAELMGVIYFILPKLESLFLAFDNVPALTTKMMGIAGWMRSNMIFLVIGVVVFILLFKTFLGTKVGILLKDRVTMYVPVFKDLTIKNNLALFARTLGALLGSGIPLEKSMQIAQGIISNSIYTKILTQLQSDISGGKNISDTLGQYPKYFPPTYVKLLEVGEQTGTLQDNLDYLYELYSEDVKEISNNLATLLEPLLLVVIGIIIAFLALSIIAPIYQITGSINGG